MKADEAEVNSELGLNSCPTLAFAVALKVHATVHRERDSEPLQALSGSSEVHQPQPELFL